MKEREALVNMIMADFSESLDAMNDGVILSGWERC